MNVAARYFLWAISLFFAMGPLALPVVNGPHEWRAIWNLQSYASSLPDLVLLCITICVVSMIDVLEVFALLTKPSHQSKPIYILFAVILLGVIVGLLFCYCFWYARFKLAPGGATAGALESMPTFILITLGVSLACRTVYLAAEA